MLMMNEIRLNIRMEKADKRKLELAAAKEHLSLSSWCRMTMLNRALEVLKTSKG